MQRGVVDLWDPEMYNYLKEAIYSLYMGKYTIQDHSEYLIYYRLSSMAKEES